MHLWFNASTWTQCIWLTFNIRCTLLTTLRQDRSNINVSRISLILRGHRQFHEHPVDMQKPEQHKNCTNWMGQPKIRRATKIRPKPNSAKMPSPMTLDRISLSGIISRTNSPDMMSISTSGRLQNATEYCQKVRDRQTVK